MLHRILPTLILVVALLPARPLPGATIEIGPADDLQGTVASLAAGDILTLQGGTYTVTSRFGITLTGTSALPITIRAKSGETPVIFRPNTDQNIVDVEYSSHLILSGLELTGGSRGLRLRHSTFITLQDCHIHHTGDGAVTANDSGASYQGLRILRNHIHHTGGYGEGMYLGCNENACQVHGSLIEGNYIHDTDGPTVIQGDGIELKEGSWGNRIRDNVIHNTGYPCIITYSTVGNGPPNILERNLLWACGDHAIQSAADAVIRNNTILGAAADGIRNQPHQNGTPSNLVIAHNTVLAPANSAIRSNSITGSVVIANNALYAQNGAAIQVSGDLTRLQVSGNAGSGSLVGLATGFNDNGNLNLDFVDAAYNGGLPQDVFPAQGSMLANSADLAYLALGDFNATSRMGSLDVGAYRYNVGANPGWPLTAGFKPSPCLFDDDFERGSTDSWTGH